VLKAKGVLFVEKEKKALWTNNDDTFDYGSVSAGILAAASKARAQQSAASYRAP